MKKFTVLLGILLVFTCKEEPKIDYAVISGTIENNVAEKLSIANDNFNQEITVEKETGLFTDTLRLEKAGFYTITVGRESSAMYLKNGNNLSITLDTKQFDESLSYEGKGSAENNYLAAKYLNNEKLKGQSNEFYNLAETDFKVKVSDIQKANENLLAEAIEVDENFKKLETQNLEYDTFSLLDGYERSHAYYTKKKDFKVSENFLPEKLKTLVFDNIESYESSSSYKNMAMGKALDKIFEDMGDDYQNASAEHLKSLDNVKIPALKNETINYLASFMISPGNPNMESLFNYFTSNSTDEKFKEELAMNFEKVKDLVRGKPSPKFVDYENHKGGTTSLADLRGKYVYVDVWATWCGPCKVEIPSLKEVESKYHDKNITFVSTSIDRAKDHEAWINMVNDKELGGVQLFADKDWKSQFVQDYNIKGIPRFILIDPDGNIVTADAPRPSNPKLIELFEELKI
ncbi:TlpA disulfide reductase family protein [Ichthyenterobacterium sp. W332]|uniref:TlpA disulfide reductase family protein n=1 Tax=Microcosmobacter mediterraneus TaxID=3075607 RepID=A0ABU2YN59_9FLAO|nr:TlpA disulfide reductase family protein [Ichthyenterobacterium sp. W332]MDT0559482.1 TlpA disulfide reductase family protein [Ichthyenterobacterium sp. W332]